MLENRPDDALGSLVKNVETVKRKESWNILHFNSVRYLDCGTVETEELTELTLLTLLTKCVD